MSNLYAPCLFYVGMYIPELTITELEDKLKSLYDERRRSNEKYSIHKGIIRKAKHSTSAEST